jgi:hypothetical protein
MSLTVSGNAFTSICGLGKSTANLKFSWSIKESNILQDLKSLSVNPREFLLPPYSLQVGSFYTVTLTATHQLSLQSASVSTQVYVRTGEVVCVLSSGPQLSHRIDEISQIDWSESYDENIPNVYGTHAGLSFSYHCFQSSPAYRDTCGLIFTTTVGTDGLTMKVDPSAAIPPAVGDVYTLTVTATSGDSPDIRTSTATVAISIVTSLAPVVALSAPSGIRINPSSKLKLVATIDLKSEGIVTWSLSDSSISLSDSALSSLTRSLPASLPGSPHVISLVLSGDALPEQSMFVFQLQVQYGQNLTTSNSIEIQTNSPPVSGSFLIDPPKGITLQVTFTFLASQWVDADLPLSYQFGFLTPLQQGVVVRSRMELSYTSGVLPAGYTDNFSLPCYVNVFDIMDASTLMMTEVIVEDTQLSLDDLDSFLQIGVNNSHDNLNDLKNVLATTTSLISRQNCSTAPLCDHLNRMACSLVAGTCGECKDGFIGLSGQSNTYCLSPNLWSRRLESVMMTSGTSCHTDIDCQDGLFLECISGTCQEIQQTCPNSCSDHGTCVFLSTRELNHILSNCSLLSSDCSAVCECDEGYVGPSCSYTILESDQIAILRQRLVENIETMTRLENADQNSIQSWVNNLYAVTADYSHLNSQTKELLGSLVKTILTLARTYHLATEQLENFSKVIEAVLSAPEHHDSFSSLLKAYSEFITSDMVQGQNNVQLVSTLLRASSAILSSNSDPSIAVPVTSLEGLSQNPTQQLEFSFELSSSMSLTLLEVRVPSLLYLNRSQLSNSLGTVLNSFPCGEKPTCSITFALNNRFIPTSLPSESRPVGTYEVSANGLVNVTANGTFFQVECTSGLMGVSVYTCPTGENLTISCDGTFIGSIRQQCPIYETSPTCALEVNQLPTGVQIACELLSYTSETTFCQCNFSSTRRRRLSDDDDQTSDPSVQFSLQSMQRSTIHDFVSTWKETDQLTLSDVKDTWTVLLTVGLIGFIFTLLVLLAVYSDMVERVAKEVQTSTTIANERLAKRGTTRKPSSKVFRNNFRRQLPQGALLVRQEFDRIEESLPAVFRADSVWNKFIREVKVYHRWLGIIFYYSPMFPRAMRVLSLFSSIIVMLFLQSITYNLADPDDGTCELCVTEVCCQQKHSSLNSNSQMCWWKVDESLGSNISSASGAVDGSCHFIPIDGDMSRMFMVAVISAVLSAPLTLSIQFIISNILSRDTITNEDLSHWRSVMSRKNFSVSSPRKKLTIESTDLEEVTGKNLKEDMKHFLNESNQHYRSLQGKEREEFAGKPLPFLSSSLFPFSSSSSLHCPSCHSCLGTCIHSLRPNP